MEEKEKNLPEENIEEVNGGGLYIYLTPDDDRNRHATIGRKPPKKENDGALI